MKKVLLALIILSIASCQPDEQIELIDGCPNFTLTLTDSHRVEMVIHSNKPTATVCITTVSVTGRIVTIPCSIVQAEDFDGWSTATTPHTVTLYIEVDGCEQIAWNYNN